MFVRVWSVESYTRKCTSLLKNVCAELCRNNLFHSRTKFLLIYHSFLPCFQTRPYYIFVPTLPHSRQSSQLGTVQQQFSSVQFDATTQLDSKLNVTLYTQSILYLFCSRPTSNRRTSVAEVDTTHVQSIRIIIGRAAPLIRTLNIDLASSSSSPQRTAWSK